jgi:hypothetical protein
MFFPRVPVRVFILAALVCSAPGIVASAWAQAQWAWRWVDENGVVHYSDQPKPGATRVELQRSQTYQAPAQAPGSAGRPQSVAPPPDAPATCVITAPAPDQVFVAVDAVTISYTGPAGGTARLLLNGAAVQRVASGTAFVVSPISRGTWSAVVAIEGAGNSGTQTCQTAPVSFYVRQPSVINRPPPRPQPR